MARKHIEDEFSLSSPSEQAASRRPVRDAGEAGERAVKGGEKELRGEARRQRPVPGLRPPLVQRRLSEASFVGQRATTSARADVRPQGGLRPSRAS